MGILLKYYWGKMENATKTVGSESIFNAPVSNLNVSEIKKIKHLNKLDIKQYRGMQTSRWRVIEENERY